jgi:uncharacterized protein YndB with AHSA1/START domain
MFTPVISTPMRLVFNRSINTRMEAVFNAWTDPFWLKQWIAPSKEHIVSVSRQELREGGEYCINMINTRKKKLHSFYGVYRKFDPPHHLVFTWNWEECSLHMGESVARLELEDVGGRTELTLIHEEFPNEEIRNRQSREWGEALDRLAKVLA